MPTKTKKPGTGTLFVVATPIGHMEDITIRALRILTEVDLIVAEDTRQTRKILTRYDVDTAMVSFHDHNKERKTPQILSKLQQGLSVAAVSDAGTPSVSDPGYYLVKRCVEKNITVTPIPGASAAIAALSVSGLPSDGFVFLGFVPRKTNKRLLLLKQLKHEMRTLVFYESPKRLLGLMEELSHMWGNREAVLGRELTKIHEEILRGPLMQIHDELSGRPSVKGECTLIVSGDKEAPEVDEKEIRKALKRLRHQEGLSLSEAAKEIAAMYGLPKRQIYNDALKMEKEK